jgi:hypothetical protein
MVVYCTKEAMNQNPLEARKMRVCQLPEPFFVKGGQVWRLQNGILESAPIYNDDTIDPTDFQEVYPTTDIPWDKELLSQQEIDSMSAILA